MDILKLYTKGLNYYKTLETQIGATYHDVKTIQNLMPYFGDNCDEMQDLQTILDEKMAHADKIARKSYINFFNMETLHLVNQYKAIINTPEVHSFMDNTSDHQYGANAAMKNQICTEFMKVIEKFQLPSDITVSTYTTDNGSETQNNASETKEKIENPLSSYGNSVVSSPLSPPLPQLPLAVPNPPPVVHHATSKLKYDRVGHFKLSINKFQGKNSNIPVDIMKKLDDKIQTHQIKTITKNHLRLFLKELKLAKYYEDINYMYCYYNNCFELYNISHIEHELITDFNKIADVYDNIVFDPPNERKNFISTQYVLYHLLQKHRFQCKLSDFNVLKTVTRLRAHDEIMKYIFDILGWSFQAT